MWWKLIGAWRKPIKCTHLSLWHLLIPILKYISYYFRQYQIIHTLWPVSGKKSYRLTSLIWCSSLQRNICELILFAEKFISQPFLLNHSYNIVFKIHSSLFVCFFVHSTYSALQLFIVMHWPTRWLILYMIHHPFSAANKKLHHNHLSFLVSVRRVYIRSIWERQKSVSLTTKTRIYIINHKEICSKWRQKIIVRKNQLFGAAANTLLINILFLSQILPFGCLRNIHETALWCFLFDSAFWWDSSLQV